MFPYLTTKEDFLHDSNYMNDLCESLNYMLRHFGGSGKEIEESERRNSKKALESLRNVLGDKRISSSIKVGFEYFPDNGDKPYKRADILLSGMNANGEKIIILLEAKSWRKLYFNNFGKNPGSNPSLQVQEYVNLIEGVNGSVKEKRIHIVPVVWLFDCTEKPTRKQNNIWRRYGKVSVFYKDGNYDGTQTIADFIAKTLNREGDYANDVFSEFKKGQPAASLRLFEKADKIVQGTQEIHLMAEQKNCYESIVKRINGGKQEKEIIQVEGGPGSGKSILALKILSYCKEKGKSVVCCYPINGPAEIYGKGIEEIQDALAVCNSKVTYDAIIVDEAQECFKGIKDKLESRLKVGGTVIYLYDCKQVSNPRDHDNLDAPDYHLDSQFRCNQHDGYLTFVYDILDNTYCFRHKANWLDFDIKIIETQNDLTSLSKLEEYTFLTGPYYAKAGRNSKLPGTELEYYWDKRHGYRFVEKKEHTGLFGGKDNIKGLECDKAVVFIAKEDLAYDNDGGVKGTDMVKNSYRILLTRGLQSCYIYAEDENLRNYLHQEKGIEYLNINSL